MSACSPGAFWLAGAALTIVALAGCTSSKTDTTSSGRTAVVSELTTDAEAAGAAYSTRHKVASRRNPAAKSKAANADISNSDSSADGFCSAAERAPNPDLRIYATWRRFALNVAEHGIAGTLRVLEDSRFTRHGASREGTHIMLPPCDPLPTRIEVLDAAGQPKQHIELAPQTDLTAHTVAPGQTLFMSRELVRCLASCWCGDHLAFWQVRNGRFARLQSRTKSGTKWAVSGVTNGCYEEGGIALSAKGAVEIHIQRSEMSFSQTRSERHYFDGSEWRAQVIVRGFPM